MWVINMAGRTIVASGPGAAGAGLRARVANMLHGGAAFGRLWVQSEWFKPAFATATRYLQGHLAFRRQLAQFFVLGTLQRPPCLQVVRGSAREPSSARPILPRGPGLRVMLERLKRPSTQALSMSRFRRPRTVWVTPAREIKSNITLGSVVASVWVSGDQAGDFASIGLMLSNLARANVSIRVSLTGPTDAVKRTPRSQVPLRTGTRHVYPCVGPGPGPGGCHPLRAGHAPLRCPR